MLLRFLLFLALLGISTAQTTAEVDAATTEPITDGPSTDAPSTDTPTDAPETVAPTTEAPETEAPSTEAPSTAAPSTAAPSTAAPSTAAPSTEPPTTTIPPPDSLSVSCTSERMMVFLDHTKHPNLDLDKVTLKDADCKLQDYGDMNGTHFWMTVPFDSCETNHTTEGDTIIYQNSIITETRAAAGSILISREFQAEFPFKCTYPRSALVSVTSFSPRERVIYTKTAGSRCASPCPSQPPISREQALLESFFHTLTQFAFDKAKDQVEKEKEAKRLPLVSSTPWSLLLLALSHLALAEKTYFSLPFIAKKFFRKDSVRDSYKTLTTELKRIEETAHTASSAGTPVEGSLMAELCRHLCQFVQARQELIDFYEAMAAMGSSSNVNCSDLSNMIDEICRRHSKGFHHPILDSLKSSFSYEVDILSNLLKAQCDMAEWKFLPSLLHLHESHVKLSSWCHVIPPAELSASLNLKKSLFGGATKKHLEAPFLYHWLGKLQDALVSKFTLYFYHILGRQTTSADMKSLTARASIDYVGRIGAFIRRSDAFNVCMLLDTHQMDPYQGHGYHLPQDIKEAPSGLGAFPAIFSFPGERPVDHWPNIVSIVLDKVQELNSPDKIVFFFDNRVQSTYFLTRVDPRTTLVVIFTNKRSEKDSYVTTFLNETATLLRNTKIFAMLKQGGKS